MFRAMTLLATVNLTNMTTPLVTNINAMFYQSPAVASLDMSGFDTSSVTEMGSVFREMTALTTCNCTGWVTSLANNMEYMFQGDPNLTDVTGVETWSLASLDQTSDLTNFIEGTGRIPTARYDALLLAWEAQDPFDGMSPNFGSSTYTGGGAVATAHASLISRDGWTITDGGVA
tara:strand:- start:31 stop:552 length:522 start_codon:yes stop_codon:yes gene_type:complete